MNTITPTDVFGNATVPEVLAWSEYARYHDVHHQTTDFIVTYLDPTVYTAWVVYDNISEHSEIDQSYFHMLRDYGYVVCYFQTQVPGSETLRTPCQMLHTHDLFGQEKFTHRIIL